MKKKKRDYKENQKKVTIYREKQNRERVMGTRTQNRSFVTSGMASPQLATEQP